MTIELYSDFLIADAAEHGDRTAVVAADGVFTYEELNRAANRFANGLLSRGIKAGDRIMVSLPKNSMPVIAMFGIMKAGAVMIPVGMDYPPGRIECIREDSKATLMIGKEAAEGITGYDEILRDADDREPPRPSIDDSALCMILYTSGSTGRPKGVMLRHRGFVNTALPYKENLLSYITSLYGHTFLGITTTTFAFFYLEYCLCIANACTYVMADQEHSRSPMLMAEFVTEYNVDVITGTPSRIMQYMDIPVYANAMRNCRILIIGGERVPAGMPEAVHQLSPECYVLNLYSLTEANGTMINGEMTSADSLSYPGYRWKFQVVDTNGNPCAPGETGELLMGGDNMMAGYANLPEEMKAKTVIIDGIQYFRTGDLVRRFEDGGFRVIGRKDHQIKLRGLRMEPGEIEKEIQAYPDARIEKAVVKVNVINHAEHLVAYYTGSQEVNERDLKSHLSNMLTAYMIPDYFMYLEQFPLNPNGKIDMKLLPELEIAGMEIVAPKDDLESYILMSCKKIVDFDDFGVTTPLENVGFTSLLYIVLASDILDQYRVELKLTDLMAGGATVRSLAEKVRTSELVGQEKQVKRDRYPLSPQMFQFVLRNPLADMYRKFEFSEKWSDARAVLSAFLRVFNAYPYLYTKLRKEDDTWYQIPYTGELLKEEDVPIRSGSPTEEEIAEFCTPFDVASADRLFEIRVYQAEKVIILLHIQHALMDHVIVEKLIDNVRRALKDPLFIVSEYADYFSYTMETADCEEEMRAAFLPEEFVLFRDQPHYTGEIATVRKGFPRGAMDPVLERYHIQPADYLFSLVSQAYLEVMGEEKAVFYNIFGGRNDARYFSTAGYFPIRMAVPVRKDTNAFKEIGKKIVDAIDSLKPQDDLTYRILMKHQYPYPYLNFNCMEMIEENEDFSLVSLIGSDSTTDPMIRAATPQVDFLCFTIGVRAAAVILNYEKSFLTEEKAMAILAKVEEINHRNLEMI